MYEIRAMICRSCLHGTDSHSCQSPECLFYGTSQRSGIRPSVRQLLQERAHEYDSAPVPRWCEPRLRRWYVPSSPEIVESVVTRAAGWLEREGVAAEDLRQWLEVGVDALVIDLRKLRSLEEASFHYDLELIREHLGGGGGQVPEEAELACRRRRCTIEK